GLLRHFLKGLRTVRGDIDLEVRIDLEELLELAAGRGVVFNDQDAARRIQAHVDGGTVVFSGAALAIGMSGRFHRGSPLCASKFPYMGTLIPNNCVSQSPSAMFNPRLITRISEATGFWLIWRRLGSQRGAKPMPRPESPLARSLQREAWCLSWRANPAPPRGSRP